MTATGERNPPSAWGVRTTRFSWRAVGGVLLAAGLAATVVPLDSGDSSCGQVLWNGHWGSPVCADSLRAWTAFAVGAGGAGLGLVVAASHRRLISALLCGALLGGLVTVNRMAQAVEDPMHCGSLVNPTRYEADPQMDHACDGHRSPRRQQAAAAGAVTTGLLAGAAVLHLRPSAGPIRPAGGAPSAQGSRHGDAP